jgi:hypothetical protein
MRGKTLSGLSPVCGCRVGSERLKSESKESSTSRSRDTTQRITWRQISCLSMFPLRCQRGRAFNYYGRSGLACTTSCCTANSECFESLKLSCACLNSNRTAILRKGARMASISLWRKSYLWRNNSLADSTHHLLLNHHRYLPRNTYIVMLFLAGLMV